MLKFKKTRAEGILRKQGSSQYKGGFYHAKQKGGFLLGSQRFVLSVVDLNQIDRATKEDKRYKIDYWARLFKARTWEEMKKLVKNNEYLEETARSIYVANADEIVRQQCLAREDAERRERSLERDNRLLKEEKAALQEKTAALQEKTAALQEKTEALQEDNAALQEKTEVLQEDNVALQEKNASLEGDINILTTHVQEQERIIAELRAKLGMQ